MKHRTCRRIFTTLAVVTGALAVAGCAGAPGKSSKRSKVEVGTAADYGVAASRRVVEPGQPVPKGGGRYQVGKPYQIAGKWYYPKEEPGYDRTGVASWYGDGFHGRLTANGEVYDTDAYSAAHPTLPLPSYARVTNLQNGRSVMVRVNDRGPYHQNRIMDLSDRVADTLGFRDRGLAKVRVQYVGRARIDGRDDRMLAASYRAGPGDEQIAADRVMVARNADTPGSLSLPASPVAVAAAPTAPKPVQVAALADPQPTMMLGSARVIDKAPASPAVSTAANRLPPLPQPASNSAAVIARDAGPAVGGPLVLLPAGAASQPAAATPTANAPRPLMSSASALPPLAPLPRPAAPASPVATTTLPAAVAPAASTLPPLAPVAVKPATGPAMNWQTGAQPVGAAPIAAPAAPAALSRPMPIAPAAGLAAPPAVRPPAAAPAYQPAKGGPQPLLPPLRSTSSSYAPERVAAGHGAIARALGESPSLDALAVALQARSAPVAR